MGFEVRNTLLGSITQSADGSERILSLQLHSSVGPVNLITAYSATLSSQEKCRTNSMTNWHPSSRESLKKAEVHSRWLQHQSWCWSSLWPTCLGHLGIGKMNEICQRLLELCCHHSLRVSKTCLHTKPQNRVPGDTQVLSTDTSLTRFSPAFPASRSNAVIRVLIAIRTTPSSAAE